MSEMVPMYGFGGDSGGTGATLTVTAPAGCTVTVSKDGKSKTKVAGADGKAVFKGLETGEWTLSIAEGEQTYGKTIHITADYTENFQVFAYIHITYPAGSTCTATDGVTTLTAPNTSGTWDCVVPNAGTWTVSLNSGFSETVTISDNGETISLNKWHIYNKGDQCSSVTGGWKAVKTEGSAKFSLNSTNMVLNSAYSGEHVIHVACKSFSSSLIKKFSKLAVTITDNKPYNNSVQVVTALRIREAADSTSTILAEYDAVKKAGSFTLDIGSISSGQPTLATYHTKITVSEIWLEV